MPEPTSDPDLAGEVDEDDQDAGGDGSAGRRRGRTGLSIPLLLGSMAFSVAVGLLVAWLVIGPSTSDDDSTVGVDQLVGGSANAPVDVSGTAKVGAPAPSGTFVYMEGTTGSMSDFKGSTTVLNFWSSTCAPCLREMPAMERVAEALDGKVRFVGVDVGDDLASGERMVRKTGVSYAQIRDPKSELTTAFGTTALPHTVVIDAKGTIVAMHDGALDEAGIRQLVGTG